MTDQHQGTHKRTCKKSGHELGQSWLGMGSLSMAFVLLSLTTMAVFTGIFLPFQLAGLLVEFGEQLGSMRFAIHQTSQGQKNIESLSWRSIPPRDQPLAISLSTLQRTSMVMPSIKTYSVEILSRPLPGSMPGQAVGVFDNSSSWAGRLSLCGESCVESMARNPAFWKLPGMPQTVETGPSSSGRWAGLHARDQPNP